MSYESRLYIVEKLDSYTNVDIDCRTVKRMCYGAVVAMFELCKVPDIPAAIKSYPDTDAYFYEGEERIVDDRYGKPLKEIPIKDMADIIESIAEDDEWSYRRFKPCVQLLRGFEDHKWKNLVVLHYGH